jgi:hypothetical protein
MRKDFKDWDYSYAQAELGKRQGAGDKESLAYVIEKNNWRDGEGWSGPQITGSSDVASVLKEGISRDFTPKGGAASTVRRFRRGTVGRESGWITSIEEGSNATEGRKEEADALLLQWWNYNKGLRVFRTAVSYCAAVGRGPLRLYPPPGVMVNGRMPVLSPQEAVKRIYLLAPKPEEASVITDTWSMKRVGVYTFDDEDGKPAIGLCYVNDQGKTVLKTLKSGSSLTQQAPGLVQRLKDYVNGEQPDSELDLKGNLLLFELDHEALVTDSVKRQQKLLDKAGTVLSHEMDEDGFREEVYWNTQPPGKTIKIDDPDNPGQQIEAFIKGPSSMFERGPGKRLFAQGLATPKYDEGGRIRGYDVQSPSKDVTDPVPVDTFIKTAEFAYRNILEDTDQLHVMISGDATSSGESRKQARDDYTKSLEEMKSEVDYIGSSIMETVLSLVAAFSKRPGYFDGIRVSFDARIDPGPLSADERRVIIEEVDKGLRSVESGMQLLGISDPDAMKAKIEEERKERAKTEPPPPVPPPNPDVQEEEGAVA